MLLIREKRLSRGTFGSSPPRVPAKSALHEWKPHELVLPPGCRFVEEGSPASHTYEIQSGALLLSRLTSEGQRHVLSILGPGNVIGRALSPVHDCTVSPLTRTVLYSLDGSMDSDDDVNEHFVMTHLHRQLIASRDHAVRLQYRAAETKLASLLLSLPSGSTLETCRVGDCVTTRIVLSLTDLSDCLALRSETISRVLSRFRRSGLISKPERGILRILNLERLSQIAQPMN